jgi:hypothetical protein
MQGGKGYSGRRLDNADAAFPCVLLHLLERLFLVLLEFLLDGLLPVLVILALEGSRDRAVGFLDQLGNVLAQFCPATGRQAQRLRILRVAEVVDVAPVVRHEPFGGP